VETALANFLAFHQSCHVLVGGGAASLGLMQREVVAAGWLTPSEFADDIALSNALPGPLPRRLLPTWDINWPVGRAHCPP